MYVSADCFYTFHAITLNKLSPDGTLFWKHFGFHSPVNFGCILSIGISDPPKNDVSNLANVWKNTNIFKLNQPGTAKYSEYHWFSILYV